VGWKVANYAFGRTRWFAYVNSGPLRGAPRPRVDRAAGGGVSATDRRALRVTRCRSPRVLSPRFDATVASRRRLPARDAPPGASGASAADAPFTSQTRWTAPARWNRDTAQRGLGASEHDRAAWFTMKLTRRIRLPRLARLARRPTRPPRTATLLACKRSGGTIVPARSRGTQESPCFRRRRLLPRRGAQAGASERF